MANKKITQEEINRTLDFLEIIKDRSDRGEPLKLKQEAKAHKIPAYAHIAKALKNLGYADLARGFNGNLLLPVIEESHAVKILLEIKKIVQHYNKNKSTSKKSSNETVEKEPREIEGFQIMNAKLILFEKAVVELAGYRISGDFTIEEING